MKKASHQPEVTALPVHFEDRSGPEFERLCLPICGDGDTGTVRGTDAASLHERHNSVAADAA